MLHSIAKLLKKSTLFLKTPRSVRAKIIIFDETKICSMRKMVIRAFTRIVVGNNYFVFVTFVN